MNKGSKIGREVGGESEYSIYEGKLQNLLSRITQRHTLLTDPRSTEKPDPVKKIALDDTPNLRKQFDDLKLSKPKKYKTNTEFEIETKLRTLESMYQSQ